MKDCSSAGDVHGARYLTPFSLEFPHFEVSSNGAGKKESIEKLMVKDFSSQTEKLERLCRLAKTPGNLVDS